jgi:tRNA(Phe) wybutosine-synthesizing methylase Tyw3
MIDSFDQRKRNVLESLESPCGGSSMLPSDVLLMNVLQFIGDKSRKGSVDAPIASLCSKINSQRDIYTTSSCSGRISVFAEPDSLSRSQGKKGGEWVFASHDRAVEQEVLARIIERKAAGSLVLRFEPFILHAECRTLEEASKVLLAARNAGYRESGATLGSRVMIAIRCSLRLEVPVADGGDLLVSESYICYLIRLANEKFTENEGRVKKLEAQLDLIWDHLAARPSRPLRPSQATISQIPQVTKGFRPSNVLDTIPVRPRNASEVMVVDPRKILLGRQLSILKRIKAVEKTLISGSHLSSSAKSAHDQFTLIHQVKSERVETSSDMKWEELAFTSESSLTVSRWGHASVLLPSGVMCIIGGYGGHGVTHTRMADVMTISLSQGGAKSLEGRMSTVKTSASDEGQGMMAARQGHTATLIDESRILVVGGRSSPAE